MKREKREKPKRAGTKFTTRGMPRKPAEPVEPKPPAPEPDKPPRWTPKEAERNFDPLAEVIDVYKCVTCGAVVAFNAEGREHTPLMACARCEGIPTMHGVRYEAHPSPAPRDEEVRKLWKEGDG